MSATHVWLACTPAVALNAELALQVQNTDSIHVRARAVGRTERGPRDALEAEAARVAELTRRETVVITWS